MSRGAVALALLVAGCGTTSPRPPLERVPSGTWGGDDAGMIVSDTDAHAHIACTLGDIVGPILLDSRGAFDVVGTYNVDAFPIDRGIRHPARFTGETDGRSLTLGVRLTDTGQVFGPVVLTLGVTPSMRNCPICRR